MNDFLQLVFQGLGIGAIYALVSLGFVLLIRAASVVNFGQGEFSMLGAYLLVVFFNMWGIPYLIGMALSVIIMAGFGLIFAYCTYWPLRFRGGLPVIISTIGASIFLQNMVLFLYGPSSVPVDDLFDTPGIQIGEVFLASQYLAIIVSRLRWWGCNTLFSRRRCSARSCRRPARTRKWPRCSAFPWC